MSSPNIHIFDELHEGTSYEDCLRIENAKQTPSEVLLTGDFIVEARNISKGTTKILARGGGEMKIQ